MGLPAWGAIGERLAALDADRTASGCHGLLCGLLAMHVPEPRTEFARLALDAEAPPELLGTLCDETLRQLDDPGFDFQLLLPDDEADLATRTRALADWCDGFVFGVGASGRRASDLPEQSAEFLNDAMRIAEADVDAAGGETDEAALAELTEYVRVGVMLIRTEAGSRKAGSQSDGAQLP
ncbi:MAG: UPF0149 family protein [Halofilum sp. (in: g-proteobacteria)]|nr:UPF0149 family protein [Halofilum sp. (in: g-proteobacteria)]